MTVRKGEDLGGKGSRVSMLEVSPGSFKQYVLDRPKRKLALVLRKESKQAMSQSLS